jgi:hypothetical protein
MQSRADTSLLRFGKQKSRRMLFRQTDPTLLLILIKLRIHKELGKALSSVCHLEGDCFADDRVEDEGKNEY